MSNYVHNDSDVHVLESRKTFLKEHMEYFKMKDDENNEEKNESGNFNEEKERMISRLINWKFSQALNYKDVLKKQDSYECLELLNELWGDTGWERGETIFGKIIYRLIELIRLKEGWSFEEFYDEEEEIDII